MSDLSTILCVIVVILILCSLSGGTIVTVNERFNALNERFDSLQSVCLRDDNRKECHDLRNRNRNWNRNWDRNWDRNWERNRDIRYKE